MKSTHVRLREWDDVGPDDPRGTELRGRGLDGSESRSLALALSKVRALDVRELRSGLHVRAFAHVGRVVLGDLVVTIEPKIGTTELLELFRYAYGLRDLQLRDEKTAFDTTGQLLQDLLAKQLLTEVSELAERGLLKRYVARTEKLSSPRGRIDISDLARRGPMTDAVLVCRHHQRSINHLLNRVLLGGLGLGAGIAQEPTLRRDLLRLASRFDGQVERVVLSTTVLDDARRRLDRLAVAYEPAVRLVELLFAGSAISLDGEGATSLRGFLFDMNRFFQALIGRFLKDHLEDCDVEEEHGLTEMMRYVVNPRRANSPRPRPDFALRSRSGTIVALLDAKYRDLWEKPLPREMLYQLSIYALSQKRGGGAVILYPTMATSALDAVVEIRGPAQGGALGFVTIRPVIVSELLAALRDHAPDRRRGLAKRLATVDIIAKTETAALARL